MTRSLKVEATQEFAVIRNLLHHLPDVPGLGFQVRQNYRLNSYGILGYALLSSPSWVVLWNWRSATLISPLPSTAIRLKK